MHIGWGDHFSLWEERLFVEGVEALSVLQGLGSGLPLKMYWTWGSYCGSSKVIVVLATPFLRNMSFSASASVSLLLEMINLSPFFIVKYTFHCPTFSLCTYDPYVYPFWIKYCSISILLFVCTYSLLDYQKDFIPHPSHSYMNYLSDWKIYCLNHLIITSKYLPI